VTGRDHHLGIRLAYFLVGLALNAVVVTVALWFLDQAHAPRGPVLIVCVPSAAWAIIVLLMYVQPWKIRGHQPREDDQGEHDGTLGYDRRGPWDPRQH